MQTAFALDLAGGTAHTAGGVLDAMVTLEEPQEERKDWWLMRYRPVGVEEIA